MSFLVSQFYNTLNQFFPYSNTNTRSDKNFFIGYKGDDTDYYCFYSSIAGYYVMTKNNVTPFGLYDETNDVQWNCIEGIRPTFQGSFSGSQLFIYEFDGDYYASPTIGKPIIFYDDYMVENNSVISNMIYNDIYIGSGSDFNSGVTFTGKGAFEGKSFTVKTKLLNDYTWINTSSSTNPYGVYTPYNGVYGASTQTSNKYLGNRYWSASGKTFVLSPDQSEHDDFQGGLGGYEISGIEHLYENNIHRWIIWGDDTKTWGYENNEQFPIEAKDYVYTGFGSAEGTSLTLVYSGYTLGDWKRNFYLIDFARIY